MTLWWWILVASAGCYALKLVGFSVPARVLEHPRVARIADVVPVGLLTALVAVQVFSSGHSLAWDWPMVGAMTCAVGLLVARAPFLVVVVAAAACAALLRLWL